VKEEEMTCSQKEFGGIFQGPDFKGRVKEPR